MTIASRRAEIATSLTTRLTAQSIKVRPYQPRQIKPFDGWLEINQTDFGGEGDTLLGDVRLSMALLIVVATTREQFEKAHDAYAFPIISAVTAAGGWDPVLTPVQEIAGSATYYSISVTFIAESEAA
jgi:hypothetical protein